MEEPITITLDICDCAGTEYVICKADAPTLSHFQLDFLLHFYIINYLSNHPNFLNTIYKLIKSIISKLIFICLSALFTHNKCFLNLSVDILNKK